MEGSIPTSLGSLSAIQYLRLHDNLLTGSLPTSMYTLPNITELWVHDNGFLCGDFNASDFLCLHEAIPCVLLSTGTTFGVDCSPFLPMPARYAYGGPLPVRRLEREE